MAIQEYIEIFYNRQRRHSRLGYVSPAHFAEIISKTTLAARNGSVHYGQYTSLNDVEREIQTFDADQRRGIRQQQGGPAADAL